MCAAQVLSNLFLQRIELGELVVYRGNALGPRSGLSVVIHTTVADLTPDLVLPAMHPSRVAAVRTVFEAHGDAGDHATSEVAQASAPRTKPTAGERHDDQRDTAQVDLFADC